MEWDVGSFKHHNNNKVAKIKILGYNVQLCQRWSPNSPPRKQDDGDENDHQHHHDDHDDRIQ